jgi:UDP-N-acetylglucosamine acyltransferase
MPDWVIAPTARIHPDAKIGPRTRIGEFCVVEQDVEIGADCLLEPYVYVKRWTTMGDGNEISAGTVLGTDPLDKNFKGDRSYLRIGNGNKIREHYTISRGTKPGTVTTIGDRNYIMTSGHIAHNCVIGDDNTIASATMVAGHTDVENQVFISGGVLIHQYSRIGRLAMISGNSRVNLDVPPFFTYTDAGDYVCPKGLNVVGMRRAGFSLEQLSQLKKAYRILYRSSLKLDAALEKIEAELPDENTLHLVRFVRASPRGICRPRLAPRVGSHAAAMGAGVEENRDDQDDQVDAS